MKTRRRGARSSAAPTTPPPTVSAAAIRIRALIVLVLAGLTYAGSVSVPFMFDDRPAIAESAAVRSLPDIRAAIDAVPESPFASRPLPSLTFALNYAIHGFDLTGYHLVNIATHLLCALLLFGVARRTFMRAGGFAPAAALDLAWVTALVWSVHPLNSEVVIYLTQRTESMMAMFYLLTLYAAIRAIDAERPARWQMLAVAACALGMGSKETMVTAPLIVVLYDRVFVYASFREALRARGRLYAGLAATLIVLAASMALSTRSSSTGFATANTSVWVYLLNQTVMITRYLRLTVWPDALVLNYGWSRATTLAAVWPYALFVVSLFVAACVALARRPALGFLGAWFFITLSPASSFVPIASEVGAERRMYLPIIALVVLAVLGGAALVRRLGGRQTSVRPLGRPSLVPLVVVAVMLSLLSARTIARIGEFRTPLTMAETVVARWPTPIAHQMVGSELVNVGRSDEAIPHLLEARRGLPTARYEYAAALFNVGRLDEAIAELQAFLQDDPDSISAPLARRALGRALGRQGRTGDAIAEFERALAVDPGDMEVRGLLADALFSQQRFDEAIRYYRDFLAAAPRHAGALANLAIALSATGAAAEALDMFRAAVEADPNNGQTRLNLVIALIEQNLVDEASGHARRAVELAPDNPTAHDLFGRLLAAQGNVAAAIAEFEQVLRLDPSNGPARDALRVLRGGRQ